MKKIFTLTLLFAFQLVVFAQDDVTSSVLTNPGFEESPFDTDWTLVINKGAATFTDAGNAEAVDVAGRGAILLGEIPLLQCCIDLHKTAAYPPVERCYKLIHDLLATANLTLDGEL